MWTYLLKKECIFRIPYYGRREREISYIWGEKTQKYTCQQESGISHLFFFFLTAISPSTRFTTQIWFRRGFRFSRSTHTVIALQKTVKPAHNAHLIRYYQYPPTAHSLGREETMKLGVTVFSILWQLSERLVYPFLLLKKLTDLSDTDTNQI